MELQDSSHAHAVPAEPSEPSDVSRWLAACAYAFVLAIFVLYEARRRPPDEYLRFHARQGFVLFFVEFVLLAISMVLNYTIGKIDVLGFVLMVTWNLVLGLLAVGISAMGFMFGLSGEMWRMPVLGRYAHRVPIG